MFLVCIKQTLKPYQIGVKIEDVKKNKDSNKTLNFFRINARRLRTKYTVV